MKDWKLPYVRCFGVVTQGYLGCPRCARIIRFSTIYQRKRIKMSPHSSEAKSKGHFDPASSILTCPRCGDTFQLGLLVWDVKGRYRRPKDQRANLRELAQLRARAGGFYLVDITKRTEDPVNRYIAGECCCDPLPWREECPIHGHLPGNPHWLGIPDPAKESKK